MSEEKQSQRNNNEEEEWEEEEFLVVMENKHFDSVELLRACKRYSISGFESETPIVKMDNLVFQGNWDEIIGTALLFEHTQQANEASDKTQLKYEGKTDKVMHIDRIIVKAKAQQ